MISRIATASCLALLGAFSNPVTAQQVAEGYRGAPTPLATTAGQVLRTAEGLAWFDGTTLWHDVPGQPSQPLLQLPNGVFGSFTIDVGNDRLLFGENSTGDLWLVPKNGPAPTQPLANLTFNYDAVAFDADHALVSAKTTGFATNDNDVVLVDLTTGATQNVAVLPGASGPLAIDDDGDVYYATSSLAFPTPAGSADVLRFPRALVDQAVANQAVLTGSDAQLVIGGLDAASDLAFDDDGDLFFSDYVNLRIGEIDGATGANAGAPHTLVDYAAASVGAATLQFVPGAGGPQRFEPFQPTGGQLVVFETDYFSQSRLRVLDARRPTLASSVPSPIPTGDFDLVTTNGPANGIGLLALTAGAPVGEVAITLGGYEQPLIVDGTMVGAAVAFVVFDATGQTTLTIPNPGFATAIDATAQVVAFSVDDALGTTAPLLLQLAQ